MKVKLSHGGGGKETASLINGLIKKHLGNEILNKMEDGAVLKMSNDIVFSTDSFVIDPVFFPGGNIGKLAVCGTVNDIAVMGAIPEYLSLALIIEEGFELEKLEEIIESIAKEAETAGIKIVCGDTKVVEKGKDISIFINTAGIGRKIKNTNPSASALKPGDAIIVNGPPGEHGAAVLQARKELNFSTKLKSDCAVLSKLCEKIYISDAEIHAIRDATRGGYSAVINELADSSNLTITLDENLIPQSKEVNAVCSLLGMNPMDMANEGKIVIAVPKKDSSKVLEILKADDLGKNAAIIGYADKKGRFPALIKTNLVVTNILEMPKGELLPRIC